MKVKRFLEYSKGEQRNLLMHWWYYYSKTQYDFMEYTKFRKAVEKDAQVVMYMVFNATLNERGNEEILAMIRNGKFEEYWDQTVRFAETDDFKMMYDANEAFLIDEIVDSYKNPKSRDDSSKGMILSNVSRIIRNNGYELTSDRVFEIYEKCLIREDDFKDGELVGDFTVSEGINGYSIFMVDRLRDSFSDIYECVEMLPGINCGTLFTKLFNTKKGDIWTRDVDVVDRLVQLGVATDMLYYPLEKKEWKSSPDGYPIVCAKFNEEQKVSGYSPSFYEKVLEKIQMGKYSKDA